MPNFTITVANGLAFVAGSGEGRGQLVLPASDLPALAQALAGSVTRSAADQQLAAHADLSATQEKHDV